MCSDVFEENTQREARIFVIRYNLHICARDWKEVEVICG